MAAEEDTDSSTLPPKSPSNDEVHFFNFEMKNISFTIIFVT